MWEGPVCRAQILGASKLSKLLKVEVVMACELGYLRRFQGLFKRGREFSAKKGETQLGSSEEP